MMLKTTMTAGFLLAAGSASDAAPTCNVPYLKGIQDVVVTGYMYVKAGKSCSITVANSPGPANETIIVQRPSHGTLEIRGLGLRYTPRAGFVGKDRFGYISHALDGRNNQPVKFPANIDVTVEP
jgi:hypothetical protein